MNQEGLTERECGCGCGQTFKPYREFQDFALPAHRDRFHTMVRTEVMRLAVKDRRLMGRAEKIVRLRIRKETAAARQR